jgi:hypothetical protein
VRLLANKDFTDSVIANTITKWKETYELSFELADVTFTVLNELMDYCKAKNIPFNEEKGIWNLVQKARSLFREIELLNSPNFNAGKISDEILQDNRSDEDLTEPFQPLYKGGIVFSEH